LNSSQNYYAVVRDVAAPDGVRADESLHEWLLAKSSKVFSGETVRRIACLSKMPAGTDLVDLTRQLQAAAYFYLESNPNPSKKQANANARLAREIKALWRVASQRRYLKALELVRSMSPELCSLIEQRRHGRVALDEISASVDCDQTRQDKACELLSAAITVGGRWRYSQEVGGDKPHCLSCASRDECSLWKGCLAGRRTWEPEYWAPKSEQNFPKRAAERVLLRRIVVAWESATSERAPRTANHFFGNPFLFFLRLSLKSLDLVHVDSVELMNSTHAEDWARALGE
jgi:hypothetical protein